MKNGMCIVAIVLVGMPGSGKGVFSDVARSLGYEVYVMGDVIREELIRRGMRVTRENMAYMARELRRLYGDDIVARRVVEEVLAKGLRATPGCRYIVIDGSRSLAELEFFRKSFSSVVLVAIHASPETRYRRLVSRGREGDPKGWDEFVERDALELSMGVGSLIALADIMIINEGIDLEGFRRTASNTLEYIRSRWRCRC
ncbi:MAG: AAA family ATPase [Sulfolobales archaeon]